MVEETFPYQLNDNTRLSRGLLFYGLERLGFSNIAEIAWKPEWLSP